MKNSIKLLLAGAGLGLLAIVGIGARGRQLARALNNTPEDPFGNMFYDVQRAQKVLIALGYELEPHGLFDQPTQAAWQAAALQHNLSGLFAPTEASRKKAIVRRRTAVQLGAIAEAQRLAS